MYLYLPRPLPLALLHRSCLCLCLCLGLGLGFGPNGCSGSLQQQTTANERGLGGTTPPKRVQEEPGRLAGAEQRAKRVLKLETKLERLQASRMELKLMMIKRGCVPCAPSGRSGRAGKGRVGRIEK